MITRVGTYFSDFWDGIATIIVSAATILTGQYYMRELHNTSLEEK